MVKPPKYVIFAQNYPKYLKIYDYKIHTYILFMKYSHIIQFFIENSLINKGKTHSLYTIRHMNPPGCQIPAILGHFEWKSYVSGIWPHGWSIYPNWYNFYGIIINFNALLYLKMILYVKITKLVSESEYRKNIYFRHFHVTLEENY